MKKLFYIKMRCNPQTGTYYVPMGQMSKRAARKAEGSLYGSNLMLGFDTEKEYKARLKELREKGERVYE